MYKSNYCFSALIKVIVSSLAADSVLLKVMINKDMWNNKLNKKQQQQQNKKNLDL